MDNDFLLADRLQKIRQVIGKYGEDNFYVSFSGGKDSCVLSALIDEAIPENKIPRVYANTGIELNMIVDFVKRERERETSAYTSSSRLFRFGKCSKKKAIRSRANIIVV